MYFHYKTHEGYSSKGKAHSAASFYGDSHKDVKDTLQYYVDRSALDLPDDEQIRPAMIVFTDFWNPLRREVDARKFQLGEDVLIRVNLNAVQDLKRAIAMSKTGVSRRGPLYKFSQNPCEVLYLPQSVVGKLQAYDFSDLEKEAERATAEIARVVNDANTAEINNANKTEKPGFWQSFLAYTGLDLLLKARKL